MSILQELIEEGVLAAWYDYKSGHSDDLSGNGNDGTPVNDPVFVGRNGLDFNNGTTKTVDCGAGLNTLQAVTVCSWFKCDAIGVNQWVFNRWFDANDSWGLLISSGGNINIFDDIDAGSAVIYTTAFDKNVWHHVAAVIAADKEQKLYLDGVLVGSGTATSDFWDSFAGEFAVGSRTGAGTLGLFGSVRDCQVVSRELDITEINTLMGETRDQRWPTKPTARIQPIMSIDGNQTDLEAAYDMRPQGNRLIDASPNGNDGTIEGSVYHGRDLLGDYMHVVGNAGYVLCGTGMNVPDDATWEAWVRTTDASGTIIGKWYAGGAARSWSFGFAVGRLGLGVSSTGANFESETDQSGVLINDGVLHHVVAVYDKSADSVSFYVDGQFTETDTFTTTTGGIFSSAAPVWIGEEASGVVFNELDGDISQIQMHQRKLTADEILAKYEAGANAVQFKTDWGTPVTIPASVGAGARLGPFTVSTGTHKITTDTIEGQLCKVIECVTAGVVYVDMLAFMGTEEAAFGTWEIWVRKDDTANDMDLVFIADTIGGLEAGTQDGYGFRYMNTDDGIYLYESVGGGLTELGHFIGLTPAEDWYLLHLDRHVSGMFDMWVINDGGVGSSLDLTTVTSRYICLEMDAGDKVAFADVQGNHSIVKKIGAV